MLAGILAPNLLHLLLERSWGSLCEPVCGMTQHFSAAEVPAKAIWVACGAAARSLGHGGPWGQLSITAQSLYLVHLKNCHSSLLKS